MASQGLASDHPLLLIQDWSKISSSVKFHSRKKNCAKKKQCPQLKLIQAILNKNFYKEPRTSNLTQTRYTK
jgi:hypothetical protein